MPQGASAISLERAGKGAGFVMVAAETSDTAGGNFLDVEKGVTGQYHPKTREQSLIREQFLLPEYH
jgi:hypothetical protein